MLQLPCFGNIYGSHDQRVLNARKDPFEQNIFLIPWLSQEQMVFCWIMLICWLDLSALTTYKPQSADGWGVLSEDALE